MSTGGAVNRKMTQIKPKSDDASREEKRGGNTRKGLIFHPTLGYAIPPPIPVSVARRNARERNRVKTVNSGFECLRLHVPSAARAKKMSKVDILRHSVSYIRTLQSILDQCEKSQEASTQPQPSPEANLLQTKEFTQSLSPVSTYSSSQLSTSLSPDSKTRELVQESANSRNLSTVEDSSYLQQDSESGYGSPTSYTYSQHSPGYQFSHRLHQNYSSHQDNHDPSNMTSIQPSSTFHGFFNQPSAHLQSPPSMEEVAIAAAGRLDTVVACSRDRVDLRLSCEDPPCQTSVYHHHHPHLSKDHFRRGGNIPPPLVPAPHSLQLEDLSVSEDDLLDAIAEWQQN